jgi:nitrate reductase delta subunit
VSRRAVPASPGQLAAARQVASLLLGYPDEELLARLPLLRRVVAELPAAVAGPLGRFLDHA